MEGSGVEVEGIERGIGDFETGTVAALVKAGSHPQARGGGPYPADDRRGPRAADRASSG